MEARHRARRSRWGSRFPPFRLHNAVVMTLYFSILFACLTAGQRDVKQNKKNMRKVLPAIRSFFSCWWPGSRDTLRCHWAPRDLSPTLSPHWGTILNTRVVVEEFLLHQRHWALGERTRMDLISLRPCFTNAFSISSTTAGPSPLMPRSLRTSTCTTRPFVLTTSTRRQD